MRITIQQEKCSGCGTCSQVCPQKILRLDGKVVVVEDERRCMGCFGCEDECPKQAIRVLRAPPGQEPALEPTPTHADACDVAVIGAGPAGLGAAIGCARAGLETIVLERLPNRSLSHHVDGGVLFAFPGITSSRLTGDSLSFPELDISLPGFHAATELELYGLIGPKGLRTDCRFPPNVPRGLVANKDRLIEALARQAEQAGAVVRFHAKVDDFLQRGDAFSGVTLAGGEQIRAKVVVAADGLLGKMSEKAGLPCNQRGAAYTNGRIEHASLLAYEFDDASELPRGLLYLTGGFDLAPGMPPAMAAIGVTDHVEIVFAFLHERKFYPADKPLDYYLQRFLASDPRVKELFGERLVGQSPRLLNGCRGLFRATNRDTVRDGLISIGDAFVAGGELGNVTALAQGIHAAKVIAQAARRNDFSRQSLAPVAEFITSDLDQMATKNGQFKTLPARLSEREIEQFFHIMQHANYPTMLFGRPSQIGWMFTKLMVRNAWRLIRHPKMFRLLVG